MIGVIKHFVDEADIASGVAPAEQLEIQEEMKLISNPGLRNLSDALNDTRAQQQMIEGNGDTSNAFQRIEEHRVEKLANKERYVKQNIAKPTRQE